MKKKNYYKTLGINRDASQKDIKAAYKKLSKLHHPDKGGDEEKFMEINEANEVLSDPEKRAEYNEFGFVTDKVKKRNGMFSDLINNILIDMLERSMTVNDRNFVAALHEHVQTGIDEADSRIVKETAMREKIRSAIPKIVSEDKENTVRMILESNVKNRDAIIASLENSKADFEWVLAKLEKYDYDLDQLGSQYGMLGEYLDKDMKELQNQERLNERTQIESVVKKKKEVEYKYEESIKPRRNHRTWQINTKTMEVKEASYVEDKTVDLEEAMKGSEGITVREIAKEPDCVYISALNKKSALDRYKKGKGSSSVPKGYMGDINFFK